MLKENIEKSAIYNSNFFEKKYIVAKLIIKIKGTIYKICLNSSYKFASRKININIILIKVNKIEPKIIWRIGCEKIFLSTKGNSINPINDKKGSLKNNQIKI